MKVQIGFQDKPLATGTLAPDGTVAWEGDPSAAPVVAYYRREGQTGEELLRTLLERLQGRWWCVPLDDEAASFTRERWPKGAPNGMGGKFKPSTDSPPPSGGVETGEHINNPTSQDREIPEVPLASSLGEPLPVLSPVMRRRLDDWIRVARLPPAEAALYGGAMARVMSSIPKGFAAEFMRATSPPAGVNFSATHSEMVLLAKQAGIHFPPGTEDYLEGFCASLRRYAGKSVVCLDGGVHGGGTLAEIYAHEVSHTIDWDFSRSDAPDWQAVFKAEIDLPHSPLSDYARTSPGEGWAEFGRLVILVPEKARSQFPKCWAVWEKHGFTY